MKATIAPHVRSIPAKTDVWLLSYATGIRWIGWGMTEPLIPVFLFSVFGDYGHSSLVDALGEAVFLFVLPIAGILADRVPIRRFLMVGLAIFFFDGLWAVAAATNRVFYAFLANAFDGAAVASDVVGRATYLRRRAPIGDLGSVMGMQNSLVNLGFIVGALVSLAVVGRVPLSWIFFGIVPTNLIALILIWRLNDRQDGIASLGKQFSKRYWNVWASALNRGAQLRGLAGLVLYFNALTGFATLLIPIYAYREGAQLTDVVLLGIVGTVPELFGFLGGIADRLRGRLVSPGLVVVGICFLALSAMKYSLALLGVVLAFRSILVLLGLVVEIQVTARVGPDRYGRVSAVFEGLKDLGKVAGAVVLGFGMDVLGPKTIFYTLAITACALSASNLLFPVSDSSVSPIAVPVGPNPD